MITMPIKCNVIYLTMKNLVIHHLSHKILVLSTLSLTVLYHSLGKSLIHKRKREDKNACLHSLITKPSRYSCGILIFQPFHDMRIL